MTDGGTPLGLDPEDLDGHTIEELTDYLDAGRVPADPSIDGSPGCALALDALERLRSLTPDLIARDTEEEPEPDASWVQSILDGIAMDARAGRRIPLTPPDEHADLALTEGALRGIVRAAENAFPGILIGRCRIDGDLTVHDAEVALAVEVSVPFGTRIRQFADELRAEIAARIDAHTALRVTAIDITVQDISSGKVE
ncbi:putative alkaline shock family protein YloU [Microbacterium ginsengiterrae]|uniref:Putative alkaline shock family protein YloU n=1 Tax=Microbacterium ginsengiterrae TaxID=546115 RepID=A0A7W9CCH5_9MICO|nr:Asp23/Gls24 family envelope stress response protein [Microbacterium ginsengiterrae]MBB5742926.1 putative alkaline shock family protein YloU [Microbacterium ginsengiterrae]